MSYRGEPYDSDYFFETGADRPEGYTDYSNMYQIAVNRADDIETQTGSVSGKDVIVYGCGLGYLCDILEQRGATVTGLDISTYAIGEATTNYPDVTFAVHDVTINYGSPNRFDLAVMCDILLCMNNENEILAIFNSAYRSVRPSGIYYLLCNMRVQDIAETYLQMDDAYLDTLITDNLGGGKTVTLEDVGHLPLEAQTRAVVV